ncbi:MAG: nuclear transport factor 2 family protein [Gemmatimonadaceae bacterium]
MSSRYRRVLVCTAALVVAAVAPHTLIGQGVSGADADVMKVVNRLFEGMRKGDSAMVRSVFHPQLRMISAAKGRDGKLHLEVETSADNFLRAVGAPHTAAWNERISNEKIHIDGPLASVWADYTFHAGEKFSHCGIDHFLLAADDAGVWKIIELSDTRRTEGCNQGTH